MKDLNKIFEEKPKDQLWNKLDKKLDSKTAVEKGAKKIKLYRIATLAAMFVALIAAVSYFNHIVNDHNPHLFASNEGFSSYILEELENDNVGLFNMASFDEIREAYNDKFGTKPTFQVAGNYIAKDGEIALEIFLKDYSYMLEFNYADFPVLSLDKMEDQTLYFTSEHYNLTLNIDAHGLQIVDSNFLPEYKNYIFNRLKNI